MRKLNLKDSLNFMRFIKKAGIRQIVIDLVNGVKDTTDSPARIGVNAFFAVMEAVSATENEQELYNLLSGPLELEPEQVAAIELTELAEKLEQMAQENNLERFFTSALGTTTTGQ